MRFKRNMFGLIATGSLVAVLATLFMILPIDIPAIGGNSLFLVKPVLAQQSTTFPADEAGISAYVNVGQTIDLAKVKNAMRGIQAEGSNYVIGIMELPGLPEEEFPHMYVSSDGWILAYYSKFAPAARIFQWYGYEGGTITTTTLQDAIAKICPTIGVNFAQAKANIGYYHFKYPEASKMTVAVEWLDKLYSGGASDSFDFSVPQDLTLYDGSWSHYVITGGSSSLYIDDDLISKMFYSGLGCDYFEDKQVAPGSLHSMRISLSYASGQAGAAVVFIYR